MWQHTKSIKGQSVNFGELHTDFIVCRRSFTVRSPVSWYKPLKILGRFLHLIHSVLAVTKTKLVLGCDFYLCSAHQASLYQTMNSFGDSVWSNLTEFWIVFLLKLFRISFCCLKLRHLSENIGMQKQKAARAKIMMGREGSPVRRERKREWKKTMHKSQPQSTEPR